MKHWSHSFRSCVFQVVMQPTQIQPRPTGRRSTCSRFRCTGPRRGQQALDILERQGHPKGVDNIEKMFRAVRLDFASA